MEDKQPGSVMARVGVQKPCSALEPRTLPLIMALAPFGAVLATRSFGNPVEHLMDGSVASALQYLLLGSLWAGVAVALTFAGQARKAAFYLVLLWLLLYLEKLNFGGASLPAALLWTNVLWLALAVEMLVTGPLIASRHTVLARAFSTLFHGALISIPLAIFAFNRSLGVALDMDAIFAVLQTDLVEAYGFAREYFQLKYLVAVAVMPALLLANNWRQDAVAPRSTVLLPAALVATLSLAVIYQIPNYSTPRLWSLGKMSFVTYRMELTEFRALRAQRAAGVGVLVAAKSGPGESFVVVIGESQSRDHMSVHGYFRETTPWLEALASDDGLVLFENAYSNHTHTDRVMGLALTEASQYNDKIHYQSASLIDIANKAGFNTAWVTNQVTIGGWDNLVTAMAEASRRYIGLNRHFGRTTQTNVHDGETILALRRVADEIDHNGNNLVFVQLMGNHNLYCDRFPEEFAVFEAGGPFLYGNAASAVGFDRRMNCYDNSMLYNDHVVARLFEEARKIDNLGAFFYFADHGQAVAAGTGHTSALFQFEMARIPLYAWFSDRYRTARPQRFEQLRQRRGDYFTNDLIYDLLIGAMGIETPHYEAENDPGTAGFSLTLDRARTLHGEKRIGDDPAVVQRLFTSGLPPRRVIAHRVNTVGKAGHAVRAGFDGAEIDLMFRQRAAGGYFELGHDDATRTHGDLEAWLAATEGWGFSKLWLDIKNLDGGNQRQALEELERLAAGYAGLKELAIVESGTREAWFADFRARGWHTSYYLPTEEILEAMRESDGLALEQLGARIARQVRAQSAAAVSFDVRLYPFVRNHLQRRLDPHVVYHAWDLSIRAWETDARRRLEAEPYYQDGRIRTIIVAMDSEYSI
jgi:heptose-I-phosphate ethanolaminephosphotransferase